MFVQVVAQIATAAVPNSVLQYLKAGQITKLEKHTGGHRPLLMMSFLRRLALKSVIAAKRESVAMCAGPLQCGVGRPDGANTIKTMTPRKLTPPESLLLLTAKRPCKMCLVDPCCTVSSKPMRILLLSSPSGTPAPQSTGCTTVLPTPKSVSTAGWIRDALSRLVVFRRAFDPVLRPVLADICRHYDPGAKLFAYLDDWYLWIKPQHLQQTVATRSVNLALQSTKTQVWRASCQDPIPPEFQDKVTLTLSYLGGHLQIRGDIEPSSSGPGQAGLHGEDNTTLSENCFHTCRPQC